MNLKSIKSYLSIFDLAGLLIRCEAVGHASNLGQRNVEQRDQHEAQLVDPIFVDRRRRRRRSDGDVFVDDSQSAANDGQRLGVQLPHRKSI